MSKRKSTAFTDSDYVIKSTIPTLEEVAQELVQEGVVEKELQSTLGSGFVIENVPVPKRAGRKAVHTFPVAQLTPGSEQSFLVPSKPEDVKKTLTRIRTFAYRNDLKVTLRQEENGVRVWRAKN